MFCWQITKYNPKNRDEQGRYLQDEWTEYGDIGRIFEEKEFTYDEYEKVESAYIQAILLFMDCLGIDSLKIVKLIYKGHYQQQIGIDNVEIKSNKPYKKEMITFIVRSVLRDKFGCVLESENIRVNFGYDYYMGLACSKECLSTIKKIEKLGLFVEKIGCEFIFDDEEDN